MQCSAFDAGFETRVHNQGMSVNQVSGVSPEKRGIMTQCSQSRSEVRDERMQGGTYVEDTMCNKASG